MNDTEKMGIGGTKLFWELFCHSIHCKGMNDKKLVEHIMMYKLFMYWARRTNRKLLIRKMFFEIPNRSPFRFIEYIITRTQNPWMNYKSVYEVWSDVFHMNVCTIGNSIKGDSAKEIYDKFLEIEYDWKLFLAKNVYKK